MYQEQESKFHFHFPAERGPQHNMVLAVYKVS